MIAVGDVVDVYSGGTLMLRNATLTKVSYSAEDMVGIWGFTCAEEGEEFEFYTNERITLVKRVKD